MKNILYIVGLIISVSASAQYPLSQKGYLNLNHNTYSWINVPNGSDTVAKMDTSRVRLFKPLVLPAYTTGSEPAINWAVGADADSTTNALWYRDGAGALHRFGSIGGTGGGGGVTSVGAFSVTSIVNGGSISGSTITFGPADATNPGMIKPTGAQTIGATWTLNNQLTLPAATTSAASLLISPSSAVNPSSPVNGQLWYNGTNLNFYNGSTTKDLLSVSCTTCFVTGGNAFGAAASIGTTDNNTLSFKINNTQVGEFYTSTGDFALGNGSGGDPNFLLYVPGTVKINGSITIGGSSGFSIGSGFSFNMYAANNSPSNYGWYFGMNNPFNSGVKTFMMTQGNTSFGSGTDTATQIYINPTYNNVGSGTYTMVDLRIAPVLTSMTGSKEIGIWQATGNNWLNSVSGNTLIGTQTDNGAFLQIAANTTTNAQIFLNGSAANVTSPTNGMLWYNSTAHTLNFRDNGTTTNLLAGGGSQTFQQTLTTGSTLTGANTVVNTGNVWTWTNGGTGVWKWSGISHDTAASFGLLGFANDSSVRAFSWAAVAAKVSPLLPSFNIFTHNGLYGSGGDSVGLGTNPLDQNTTINTAGFNFLIEGSLNVNTSSSTAIAGPALTINGNVSSTLGTNTRGFWLNIPRANTYTEGGSGSLSAGSTVFLGDQTWAAGSATTYTVGSTLQINGPPAAGANVTITTPYALYIFSGNTYTGGNILTGDGQTISTTHILGNNLTGGGSAPSITAGAGAGTSPTVSLSGDDMSGTITVTTGTLPTGSATVATITYGLVFPNNSYASLYPANAVTAALGSLMVYTTGSTTNFTLTAPSAGLAAATTYKWVYRVGGN